MIELNKKTGINLKKGSKISLIKEDKAKLEKICIGLDWGGIKKKVLGLFSTIESVDLDASVVMLDENGNKVDTVFFNRKMSMDGAIHHSGDDRTGDFTEDELDNEVITINLPKLSSKITQLVFFLNSFKGHCFDKIPYSKIRIYEGTPSKINSVFASYNLSAEDNFKNKTSMIMGRCVKVNNEWQFEAIGQPSSTRNLNETIVEIIEKFGKSHL